MIWANLVSVWLSLTAVFVSIVNVRRRGKLLEMAYRRESALAGMLQTDEEGFDGAYVAFADECWNQQRHLASRLFLLWPRVPDLGQPWPDFEPAPVVTSDGP